MPSETTTQALGRRCTEIAFELYTREQYGATLRAALAALIVDPPPQSRRGLLSIAVRSAVGPRAIEGVRSLLTWAGFIHPHSVDPEEQYRLEIKDNPKSPFIHYSLGLYFLAHNQSIRGYACLRTAMALAHLQDQSDLKIQEALHSAENQLGLSEGMATEPFTRLVARGDPYGRLQLMARQIVSGMENKSDYVLDIGGGDGFLSVLIPQTNYVLIEPGVNGLSSLRLPFSDQTFGLSVCSHVFEHIEKDSRGQFLDEITRVSKQRIIMLGPFAPAEGRPLTEQSILAATGTAWAREHLECGLPNLDEMRGYFEKRQLRYEIVPHADARVMYWQFLADHFARRAGEHEAISDATIFFRRYFDYRPVNPLEPHDFLVQVWLS